MITTFDKKTLQAVQDECLAALQAVAQKHGLTVRSRGGTLDPAESILKFTFKTLASADDPTLTHEGKLWSIYAPDEGLAADALGKWFTNGTDEWRVIGWRASAPKRPVLVKAKSGKTQVANVAWFKSLRPVEAL